MLIVRRPVPQAQHKSTIVPGKRNTIMADTHHKALPAINNVGLDLHELCVTDDADFLHCTALETAEGGVAKAAQRAL